MPTLSARTLAALARERGEEFDPALTLPSSPLAENLALLAGARPLVCELSPTERRQRCARAGPHARPCRAGSRSATSREPGTRRHRAGSEAA